ncbi:MAG: ATP-binding protein [Ignavibacteriae bacterium]|nr:ATP-binding protein [Ignavibacteria bacterium]MBI3365302.1 ATP-binding protein [Ignavibacteriota bacterium]
MAHPEPVSFSLVLSSKPNEIVKVEGFLAKINTTLQLDETKFNKLLIATTEAVNNGILHGNKRDPQKNVTLTCQANHTSLIVTVQDEGPGVDPDNIADPLAEENLMRENGRGVFLMRSLMDSISFEKFPGGSRVIMKMLLVT